MKTDTTTTTHTVTPQAWVGCLGCSTEGTPTGRWVHGTDADTVTVCSDPTHEETWVFDHDGYFGVIEGETSPRVAATIARILQPCLEEHGTTVVAHGVEYHGRDIFGDQFAEDLHRVVLHDSEEECHAWLIGEQMNIIRDTITEPYIAGLIDEDKVLARALDWTVVQHVNGHGWASIQS